jgi:hypothetical protein
MKGFGILWVTAVDRHLTLLHRLQQRGLRLGRGAVDFIRQHDLGEDRAGAKLEFLALLVEDVDARHVGGEHVRRKLDAAKRAADAERQRPRQHGLADARHILDQQVAFAQHRQQRQAHLVVFADNHLAYVFGDAVGNRLNNFHVSFLQSVRPPKSQSDTIPQVTPLGKPMVRFPSLRPCVIIIATVSAATRAAIPNRTAQHPQSPWN